MKKIYLLSLVALLAFAACSKDGVNENDTPALPKKMLVFNNEDEFLAASTKVANMTEDELEAYEELNGFKSLGRIAEKAFFSVDPDSFTSEEEMLAYLDANKKYINLVTDENGEFTAEPAFNDSEFKYLINEDQMFEINGTTYKVFQEGMVSAPKDQINELMVLDSEKLQSISANAKFMHTPFQRELITKAGDYKNKGWAVKGRERMHVKISNLWVPIQWIANRSIKMKAEAHKSSWGVWWIVKRTITSEFEVTIRKKGDAKAQSLTTGKLTNYAHEVDSKVHELGYMRVERFDIWASSPEAGKAHISYDSGIRD